MYCGFAERTSEMKSTSSRPAYSCATSSVKNSWHGKARHTHGELHAYSAVAARHSALSPEQHKANLTHRELFVLVVLCAKLGRIHKHKFNAREQLNQKGRVRSWSYTKKRGPTKYEQK
jgi:hypothetical protein